MRFAKLDLGALDALAETVPSQFPLDIRNLLRLLQIILLIPFPFTWGVYYLVGGGGFSIRGNRLFQDLILRSWNKKHITWYNNGHIKWIQMSDLKACSSSGNHQTSPQPIRSSESTTATKWFRTAATWLRLASKHIFESKNSWHSSNIFQADCSKVSKQHDPPDDQICQETLADPSFPIAAQWGLEQKKTQQYWQTTRRMALADFAEAISAHHELRKNICSWKPDGF